ncbi:MAG: NUDIX hydrolase [Deltaproteobacteria bacterium]|nr:MAG: NUDIX hydrolase [Deltaproteobacteria bacterium]
MCPADKEGEMKDLWEKMSEEVVFENGLFRVVHARYRLSPRKRESVFATLSTADWINVIPITEEGRFVLIRQFRHGTEEITVEIPGGSVERGEDPLEAARRELEEETGYTGGKWELIGSVTPNPAIQDNRCYTFLARGVKRGGEKKEDDMEFIEVFEARPDEVRKMLTDGTISHALVLAAFVHYLLKGHTLD